MNEPEPQAETIARLVRWGEQQPLVRAMILTSTRAIPNSTSDRFSDYDVILALSDIRPFYEDREWLHAFGPLLTLYRDPLELYYDHLKSSYVVQYENGFKIDFSLWPVEVMQHVVAAPQLKPELDAGYLVMLDKDNLTDGLKPPSYKGYIPTPPSEREYQEKVECFFLDTVYVAKFLWRNDMAAVKYILDNMIKQDYMLPMLEWRMEIDNNWTVKPGPYGRRLKKWLRPDLWSAFENTYVGAGVEENWQALDRTIELFRKVTLEVGELLGYAYLHDVDRRTVAYIQKVQALEPQE